MLTISSPCPRCLQPHTTLQLAYADPDRQGFPDPAFRETAFRCAHCQQLVLVTVLTPQSRYLGPLDVQGKLAPKGDIAKVDGIEVGQILPEMPKNDAPEHCPIQVSKAFLDGAANLEQARWTAAATCYRMSIDRASKLLWQENCEDDMPHNLWKRIEKLSSKIEMPNSLVSWAEVVKTVGNEMRELDDVSEEDARDAAHFAEVFLTYMYTLPERLAQFRARRTPPVAEAQNSLGELRHMTGAQISAVVSKVESGHPR